MTSGPGSVPPPHTPADHGPDPLRSVSIALAILESLADLPEAGPTAVAARVSIAKSTASRTMRVMAEAGLLERTAAGRYRLGLRLFEYGQLALSRVNLFEVGVPILAQLRDRVRELVQLGVPVGAEVLFLDRFEAQDLDPRFHLQTWRRVPGHSSSSGRAIAAFNPTVAAEIFRAGLVRRTRYTVTDPRRLREILDETHRRGYAATDEELEERLSSVAAPILVRTAAGRHAIAAVSVAGPSGRMHRDGITTIARHARQAAQLISDRLSPGR